jgi:glyoxylase-like metal-dependent hydrolase (beta-lactamase superfamily II)
VYPIKVSKNLFHNYCYIIAHEKTKEAVLIDPAWEIDKIEKIIRENNLNPIAVLLTHHHHDHINLADYFAKQYDITVRMSKIEIDYYGFSCGNLIPIDEYNIAFSLGEIKILPLLTSGHTKGAISYWIDDALFSGDTLFIEGCGMCFGKGADPNLMFESLSFLKNILPLHTKIFPGHSYGEKPGKDFSYLLHNNLYLQITERKQFITYRMRNNQPNLFSFK